MFNLIVQSANLSVEPRAAHPRRHARARRGHSRLAIRNLKRVGGRDDARP
jgi:hypothetical protein